MRICFYGAGAWGTALALVASREHDVVLYARDQAQAMHLSQTRVNQRYLDGITLPPSLRITSDQKEALRAIDLCVIATPVAGLREAATTVHSAHAAPMVWLCKGFEDGSARLPHEVVEQALGPLAGASLSGPSFALEVARSQPTALTVASRHAELNALVVSAFHHGTLRVYSSDDIAGVEVGGALKNVLAIATGICDGLGLGLNARAALMTRGLAEMMRFGERLGARSETLTGLSGLGDLILTCTGALSRNRRVGLALGAGMSLKAALADLGHVAEGVRCVSAALERARMLGVELPICAAVHGVLFEDVAPSTAVAGLLSRAPRAE